MSGSFRRVYLLMALGGLCILYALYPWEWGIMDDTEYVLHAHEWVDKHGFVQGIFGRIGDHMRLDLGFAGILRPGFWVYTATVYLLPPRLVYLLRFIGLIMVLGATIGALGRVRPVFTSRMRTNAVFAIAMVLSIRGIYDGVFLVSLQEFSGLIAAAIAIYILADPEIERKASKQACVIALFFVAASFKPPFVWLLATFGAFLFFRGLWAASSISLAIWAVFLFFSAQFARSGVYSAQIYQFDVSRMGTSLLSFARHFAAPGVVLAAFAGYLRQNELLAVNGWRWSGDPFKWSHAAWVWMQVFLAGMLYLATMLPRGIAKGYGYYLGPPVYLVATGLFLALQWWASDVPPNARERRNCFLIGLAVFSALSILVFSSIKAISRDRSVRGVRDWALLLPKSGVKLATNSNEVAVRLSEIMKMRTNGAWSNIFISLTAKDPIAADLDYYVVFDDQVEPNRTAEQELVLELPSARIWHLLK